MIEKLAYRGWPNCYKLSNNCIELILATDIGPRVLSLALAGSDHVFHENVDDLGQTGGDRWRRYGGHRLLHAPSNRLQTNLADNTSVLIEGRPLSARIFQYTHRTTGIQKEIEVQLKSNAGHVIVTHRLTNNGAWPVELAAWTITDMADGGVGILPLPSRRIHDPDIFHPPHQVGIWDYSDMSDPRWTWGNRYVTLRGDQAFNSEQRAGMEVEAGWIAYAVHNQLFVKKFTPNAGSVYPYGCSAMLFAGQEAYQLETLSPLTTLQPRQTLIFTEEWLLFDGVAMPHTDAQIDKSVSWE